MNKVYLACYHGTATKYIHRLCDNITRFFTRGKYSHCEIALDMGNGQYACYSSSYRDGGVRRKVMALDDKKWDLFSLEGLSQSDILRYYQNTQGMDYDLLGALGSVSGFRQHAQRYFCSEWCYNVIFGSNQGWRFSPVLLAEIVKHLSHLDDDC